MLSHYSAILAVFFLNATVLGHWIPRIPDVQASLGLSDGQLGWCLLAIPAGTLSGLFLAGHLVEKIGERRSCQIFLPGWALLFLLPALAGSMFTLAVALFVAGIMVGFMEVGMNTAADRLERDTGRRFMSRCHGFWSLGSMFGALAGGALAQFGLSVLAHFALAMPITALLGWWASSALPRPSVVHRATSGGDVDDGLCDLEPAMHAPLVTWPSRSLWLLCLMPVGIMMVEGAYIDWSAVFMRSTLDAPPIVVGVVYAMFSVIMALVRLYGDRLAEWMGDVLLVRLSGIAATCGILLFAQASTVPMAMFGAVLSGAGVAVVYPLAVSAAARHRVGSAANNVAAITMIAFSAFLIAPPLIGWMSELSSLGFALSLLAPIAFLSVLLAGQVRRERMAASLARPLPGSEAGR